jgi:hypothetical protein
VKPFEELIERQITFFREDHADLVERCLAAERAYDHAPRTEAEQRYAEYLELVEEAVDTLAEIRDNYARTLEHEQAELYEAAFELEVKRRLPRFGLGL